MNFISKLENVVRHNYYIKWVTAQCFKFMCGFYPSFDANRMYKRCFGRKANLQNPSNLIEKNIWMELYADTSMWTYCEDKYLMREYVREKGFEQYLPLLYGKWDKAEDIDFTILPDKFVMKTNHGCGDVLVCTDKHKIDERIVKRNFKRVLSIPYGYNNASLHYTKIKPCVIAEELLCNDYSSISSTMVDFKVWCINGKAKSVWIGYNRHSDFLYMDFYDLQWNRMPDKLVASDHYRFNETVVFPKPNCLDEMIKIAEGLADKFPQVRVDFYIVDSKPVIGEMSFFTGYGYFTEEYYEELGKDIQLPL